MFEIYREGVYISYVCLFTIIETRQGELHQMVCEMPGNLKWGAKNMVQYLLKRSGFVCSYDALWVHGGLGHLGPARRAGREKARGTGPGRTRRNKAACHVCMEWGTIQPIYQRLISVYSNQVHCWHERFTTKIVDCHFLGAIPHSWFNFVLGHFQGTTFKIPTLISLLGQGRDPGQGHLMQQASWQGMILLRA